MKSFLLNFLPHGLVEAIRFRGHLNILGLNKLQATQLALRGEAASRFVRACLHLFPAGSFKNVGPVLDIGSNRGDWAEAVMEFCAPRSVLCFEPDPHLVVGLKNRFADRSSVRVIQAAVGAAKSTGVLNLSERPEFNSLLTTSSPISGWYSSTAIAIGTASVEILPLDSVTQDIDRISILKIDVQGFEKQVILGGTRTLKKTDYVLIEANFQRHYEGESSFFEIDALLQDFGFSLANISSPMIANGVALWSDCLYVRREL
ncbi:MAG: FkbM family methyltransferase [Acidobacteria bacterium]|nr:FkbM family methyltransferase [Acidobacteriota bacterium]